VRTGLDIAVAGAGPGGLATALYLHRDGHRVTLFERFETPHPVGSGLILQPTGLAVLDDLGLHPAIAALGQPLDRLIGHDARTGRVVLDVRYASLSGLGRGLGVHRAALFSVLHEAVVSAGIPVRTGFTVTGMDGALGAVRLKSAQVTEGPFDLVVDTLGAGSPLKAYSREADAARQLAFGAIWATTPWAAGFDPHALMQRYRQARIMVGVLPIGRQRVGGPGLAGFFWSLKTAEFEALKARGIEAWKAEVLQHWPETAPHLAALPGFEAMTLARYAHHTLRVPAGEGVVFIGDSAHATSPQLGQGANMALLDACAFVLALRGARDLASAIEGYVKLRRWHVRLYQALSLTFTPYYQSDSTLLPIVRDLFVSLLARIPPAPQFLAAMVAGELLSPLKALQLSHPPALKAVPA
jgi:2-polyprenyl-6-methoxyphenol hydroxylase-like FAD-dependent oxidoreductase